MNHNNPPAYNQQILGIKDKPVEKNYLQHTNNDIYNNIRVLNNEIMPFVGLGLIALFYLFYRK